MWSWPSPAATASSAHSAGIGVLGATPWGRPSRTALGPFESVPASTQPAKKAATTTTAIQRMVGTRHWLNGNGHGAGAGAGFDASNSTTYNPLVPSYTTSLPSGNGFASSTTGAWLNWWAAVNTGFVGAMSGWKLP